MSATVFGWKGDVLVIGGGPAGLYAAQLLAKSGLGVRVLEEDARIGDPAHCTGVVSRDVLTLPGLPHGVVRAHPDHARLHSPGGYVLACEGPQGGICVVDRRAFDRGLAETAADAGAAIVTGARAVSLRVEGDGVAVMANIRGRLIEMRSRICVLACGARYRFQRQLGWGQPSLLLSSAQVELNSAVTGGLHVFFLPEVAPEGFGWLVPFATSATHRAKVGVIARKHPTRPLQRLLGDLRARGLVDGEQGPVLVRPVPLAPLGRTYGDRVLAIGDAAGLVKPTTGGGIYYSLLSARWAATTMVGAFERGDYSRLALRSYEDMWRARLGQELSTGVWFRRLTRMLTSADLDALTQLAITEGLIPTIRAVTQFNWHRELIVGLLSHPGVFRILLWRLAGLAMPSAASA